MCMLLSKNSKLNKHLNNLFKVITMSFVFLIVMNKDVVFFIENFINSLPIGSDFIRSIAVEVYIGLRAIIDGPSVVAVLIVCLHLFYISYNIYFLLQQSYVWTVDKENCSDVVCTELSSTPREFNNRYFYLKLARLLY